MRWRIYLSRFINWYWFDGSPDEMLSSRMHREHWRIEIVIDYVFFWHKAHCERCYRYEQRERYRKDK